MTKASKKVSLADCPIGLFKAESGSLCLKTEYGTNEGRIDAYIVSSGEFFWGAQPQTIASQRQQLVTPVGIREVLSAEKLQGVRAADLVNLGLGREIYEATLAGTEAARDAALAECKSLRRELEIERMPVCFSCGAKVTESCKRPPDKDCGREYLGGSRDALKP